MASDVRSDLMKPLLSEVLCERSASLLDVGCNRPALGPPSLNEEWQNLKRRHKSESPRAVRRKDPLLKRGSACNAGTMDLFSTLPMNPAAEMTRLKYQYRTLCQCGQELEESGTSRDVGLCLECLDCPKECRGCQKQLNAKNLRFGSDLCGVCFRDLEAVGFKCKGCDDNLSLDNPNWNTGFCEDCYKDNCRKCGDPLAKDCKRWSTKLCDTCYDDVPKDCRRCNIRITDEHLHFYTGLCNCCYDLKEKDCSGVGCRQRIHIGMTWYLTGMCDACYHNSREICKKCNKVPVDHSSITGLCDPCYDQCPRQCWMCKSVIGLNQLHWGTGVCDCCWESHRACLKCKAAFQNARHWHSFLCDRCYDDSEKTCRKCSEKMHLGQLHWGSRLCNHCYDSYDKQCRVCRTGIPLGQMHWGTSMCNNCFDNRQHGGSLPEGVRAIIACQLVFYLAPSTLLPSLFLRIKEKAYAPSAPAFYAIVLSVANFAAMLVPLPLGYWAEKRGEREVYCGIAMIGLISGLIFSFNTPSPFFALAWVGINLPQAARGIRAAYFAKRVAPDNLSRAAQFASSFGLIGGFLGPVVSVLSNGILGRHSDDSKPDGFTACAIFSAITFFVCIPFLALALKGFMKKKINAESGGGSGTSVFVTCERCDATLKPEEQEFTLALCNNCYDNFGGNNCNFKRYAKNILVRFCLLSMLLEIGMNAGVISTFQPIAVNQFNWGSDAIAAVNFFGAGLSVLVSFLMAHLRLPDLVQMAFAAGLYLACVIIYSAPPLAEWRLVVGLILGIKAQIIFMAPFTAMFSRLIGKARVTNRLTTWLCLAPAIGAALGTTLAPFFVELAGTPLAMLSAVPVGVAVFCIATWWPALV